MDCIYNNIVHGLGGVPYSELVIFSLPESSIRTFSSDVEILGRAFVSHDAHTADGSSPKLRVNRASLVLMPPVYRGGYCAAVHLSYRVWFSASCVYRGRCDAWCVVCFKMQR